MFGFGYPTSLQPPERQQHIFRSQLTTQHQSHNHGSDTGPNDPSGSPAIVCYCPSRALQFFFFHRYALTITSYWILFPITIVMVLLTPREAKETPGLSPRLIFSGSYWCITTLCDGPHAIRSPETRHQSHPREVSHVASSIFSPKQTNLSILSRSSRNLLHGVSLRQNLDQISLSSFVARKNYLVAAYQRGEFLRDPENKGKPPANPMTDPAGMDQMMNMLKGNMAMMVPQTLIMGWINAFFSGFVISELKLCVTVRKWVEQQALTGGWKKSEIAIPVNYSVQIDVADRCGDERYGRQMGFVVIMVPVTLLFLLFFSLSLSLSCISFAFFFVVANSRVPIGTSLTSSVSAPSSPLSSVTTMQPTKWLHRWVASALLVVQACSPQDRTRIKCSLPKRKTSRLSVVNTSGCLMV